MANRHVVSSPYGDRVIAETRSGLQSSWGGMGGYPIMDPSAIPPPGFSNQQRAGVLVTQHSLLQVDVVFTALRIISNNVIKMGDLLAYREAVTDDGIVYRQFLKDRPSVLTDSFGGGYVGGRGGAMMQCTGRDRTVWSMALFGEAFWYVLERDSRVRPSCLEVLHPAFMEVKEGKNGPRFIYGTGMEKQELDPDDVIHIPFKTMPQARRALSPITYAGVAGALAMAAYEFGSTWFSQGSAPSFLLRTDAKLGTEEVERIAQKFAIQHAGLANAHLPLVLDSGMDAKPLLANPDEAQYLRTLEYARNVIASWFGLPPSLLGNALERQTPAPAHTSEEESTKFLQHTLSGYLVPLEEAHSGLLAKGVKACFNENALSKPDSQFLSQLVLSIRQSQTMSIDELRSRYYGLGPLPDGQGANALAPLASNTAPSQTPSPDGTSQQPKGTGKQLDDSQQRALEWLVRRMGDYRDEEFDRLGGRDQRFHLHVEPAPVTIAPAPPVKVNVRPTPVNIDSRVQVEPTPVNIDNKVEVESAQIKVEVEPTPVSIENRIEPTPVNIENRIEPTPVSIENRVEPTPVNVEAPNVEIKPEIRVDAPEIYVDAVPPKRRVKVVRDTQTGRIVKIEDEEE